MIILLVFAILYFTTNTEGGLLEDMGFSGGISLFDGFHGDYSGSADSSSAGHGGGNGYGGDDGGRVTHITLHKEVGVPHPVPVPYKVIKKVPVAYKVPVPYKIDKPYPVAVPKKVPVLVEKPYPVKVIKNIPVPVKVPYKIGVPFKVPVHIPKPVAVPVFKQIPVHVPEYNFIKKSYPVFIETGAENSGHSEGYGNNVVDYGNMNFGGDEHLSINSGIGDFSGHIFSGGYAGEDFSNGYDHH